MENFNINTAGFFIVGVFIITWVVALATVSTTRNGDGTDHASGHAQSACAHGLQGGFAATIRLVSAGEADSPRSGRPSVTTARPSSAERFATSSPGRF